MNKFEALPEEKQKVIIDAIITCFGELGYKKASTADIAKMAGISKGMIFHYFGTKKDMYLYALEFCGKDIMQSFKEISTQLPSDFFERIIFVSKYKIEILKKYPGMMRFVSSILKESDAEVQEGLQYIVKKGNFISSEFILTDFDRKKFKQSVNPELVLDLMVGYSYGAVNLFKTNDNSELDELQDKITNCLMMLRNNFYKEEYL